MSTVTVSMTKKLEFATGCASKPSVSVGNVGQLTADLLISTLWMEKVGYIYHESILPVVGNNPFINTDADCCHLMTSCEVFENVEMKIVVIQQRAPFVKGKRSMFQKWLIDWIKDKKFEQIVVLTSSFGSERLDKQLKGSQLRFLASPKMEKHGSGFHHKHHWEELEKRQSFPAPSPLQSGNGEGDTNSIYIPGGGIAKSLFKECFEEFAIVVLIKFCEEGDNIPDALQLADYLNSWLNLTKDQDIKNDADSDVKSSWKIPPSWKLTFGRRFDQTLFH